MAAADKHYCLFTGSLLDENTNKEHTIPRSVGGRLKSRLVSSSVFNEKCNQKVDKALAEVFLLFYNRLGPLLPSELQPSPVEVRFPDHDGNYILKPGGVVETTGWWVASRDDQGKPKSIEGEEVSVCMYMQRHNVPEEKFEKTRRPEGILQTRPFYGGKEVELSVLKSTMLTFDHLLIGHPNRFTRSDSLDEVRQQVRSAILEDGQPSRLSSFVLGIDYTILDRIHELRKRYDEKEPTKFEHILLASGNIATRVLDVVWCVFGFEPYRFRLSSNWRGPEFNYLVTSGILKGTTAPSTVVEFAEPFYAGGQTNCRSVFRTKEDGLLAERAMEEVLSRRIDAFREATYLLETEADDLVLSVILDSAQTLAEEEKQGCPVLKGVELRLLDLYSDRISEGNDEAVFRGLLQKIRNEIPPERAEDSVTAEMESRQRIDGQFWLGVHRKVLDKLVESYGLPGVLSFPDLSFELQKYGQLDPPDRGFPKKKSNT